MFTADTHTGPCAGDTVTAVTRGPSKARHVMKMDEADANALTLTLVWGPLAG